MALVECVPNVSEGVRQDVIAACARAIQDAGATLLDQHVDPSHNRSVFTFAGPPAVAMAAALALADVAIRRIDLRDHRGVHPRLGAIDVIPFVPIRGATLDDCVQLARTTGAEIARRHDLPVYLYEAAAALPARRRLEDVRRGQFEGLAARLESAEWAPDFGPARPHPSAGATVAGARNFLVAYNVNLATDRVGIARAIAKVIRERSGGLPGVKALGLLLADRQLAQVSTNLTDVLRTTMPMAFDAIAREASAHGVEILESELVGLAPRLAFGGTDGVHLKIRGFTPAQILENRLEECGLGLEA